MSIIFVVLVVIGLACWAANSTDEPADHYAERIRQLEEPRA